MYLTNLGNYHSTFIILSKTLEDYIPKIHILIHILNYCYCRLLMMCFLLSLSNQHQRSKWGYMLVFIGSSHTRCPNTCQCPLDHLARQGNIRKTGLCYNKTLLL